MAFLTGVAVGGIFGLSKILTQAPRPSTGSCAVPPKKTREKSC